MIYIKYQNFQFTALENQFMKNRLRFYLNWYEKKNALMKRFPTHLFLLIYVSKCLKLPNAQIAKINQIQKISNRTAFPIFGKTKRFFSKCSQSYYFAPNCRER